MESIAWDVSLGSAVVRGQCLVRALGSEDTGQVVDVEGTLCVVGPIFAAPSCAHDFS